MKKNETNHIKDEFDLLELMVKDARKSKGVYKVGAYWANKTRSAIGEIYKFGLNDFRGSGNSAANSFGDNVILDALGNYNLGLRWLLLKIYRNIYPFSRLFESQKNLALHYFKESNTYKNSYLASLKRVKFLLSRYQFNFETTKGGCLSFGEFNAQNISHHYLQILDTLDHINNKIDIAGVKTYFEIGGGFGVNVHLLVEFFKVKKIIYLDIAPNLYIGTQYLKSFYGSKVIDYTKNKYMKIIEFSDSDELEIFCITPEQIELIGSKIDFFHNAHSFVEMPFDTVKNYVNKILLLMTPEKSFVSLVSYDGYDLSTTINPAELPVLFADKFEADIFETLDPGRNNFHYTIRL
jgi:putative sugar O-methyltransferase